MALCKRCNAGELASIATDIANLDLEIKTLENATTDLQGCLNYMKCTHDALAATAGAYERIGASSDYANNAFANNSADIAFLSNEASEMDKTLKDAKETIKEKRALRKELKQKQTDAVDHHVTGYGYNDITGESYTIYCDS